MIVILEKNGKVIKEGLPEDIREIIEEMIAERIGLYLELQENSDDDEYQVYLHTDCYDYLSDEDVSRLSDMKITDSPEQSTEGIKRLLGIELKIA